MKNAGIEATKVMMKSRPARKAVFLRGVNLDSCLVAARGRPRAKRTVGRTSDVSAHGGPPFRRGVSRGWAERARCPLAVTTPEGSGWPQPMSTRLCCKAMQGSNRRAAGSDREFRLLRSRLGLPVSLVRPGWTLGMGRGGLRMRTRSMVRSMVVAAIAASFALVSTAASADPGDPDPGWSGNGLARDGLGDDASGVRVLVLGNGKVIVVGDIDEGGSTHRDVL